MLLKIGASINYFVIRNVTQPDGKMSTKATKTFSFLSLHNKEFIKLSNN